jgi:hypothetical protein
MAADPQAHQPPSAGALSGSRSRRCCSPFPSHWPSPRTAGCCACRCRQRAAAEHESPAPQSHDRRRADQPFRRADSSTSGHDGRAAPCSVPAGHDWSVSVYPQPDVYRACCRGPGRRAPGWVVLAVGHRSALYAGHDTAGHPPRGGIPHPPIRRGLRALPIAGSTVDLIATTETQHGGQHVGAPAYGARQDSRPLSSGLVSMGVRVLVKDRRVRNL